MSEPVIYLSNWFGKRHTALMIVRSLAIWVSTLMMLGLMAAPAYFHGKQVPGSTVIGALVLLAIAQAAQALTLYVWTKPDLRRVVWDHDTLVLTVCGFRVSKKFWSFGKVEPEFQLPLGDIREVTFERGYGSHLRFSTKRGFFCVSNDLSNFTQLKDLILDLVQNPPKPESRNRVSTS